MRWVEAVKLWNADTKDVSTKNAYAIPRKNTNEYKSVKNIMEGKPEIKKIMEKRAEPVAPKEVMATHVVKKEVSPPKTNNMMPEIAPDEKKLNALNEVIMYKTKWNKYSDGFKRGFLNDYKLFKNLRLYSKFSHLVLPPTDHIKKFAEEEQIDLTTPF
jgi:hypothetical protein